MSPAHFSSEEEAQRAQDEGIAIMKIGPGQSLKLTAIAYKGIAKEHAKWSPVSVATYKFDPIIRFDEGDDAWMKCLRDILVDFVGSIQHVHFFFKNMQSVSTMCSHRSKSGNL